MPQMMDEEQAELPLWKQVLLGLWALGCVVVFVRQILLAAGGG